VLGGEEAHRELPGDRYRLKAPVFTSNEDVEQCIQEFSDVAEFSQWRMSLAEKAKTLWVGT